MPNCYQCTVLSSSYEPLAIGVCTRCNNLACAGHGGRPFSVRRFRCSDCCVGIYTKSCGGGGGDGGGGGRGDPVPPAPRPRRWRTRASRPPQARVRQHRRLRSPASPSGPCIRKLPATDPTRRSPQVRPATVRSPTRRRDARAELPPTGGRRPGSTDPADLVDEQFFSDTFRPILEERGGRDELTRSSIEEIISRIRGWLDGRPHPLDGRDLPGQWTKPIWLGERSDGQVSSTS